QQHKHDVGHGNDIGGRHLCTGLRLIGHEFMPSSRLLLGAAAQDEVVDELHGGVVHVHVESFDLVGEVVVSPHGGNGDEQAEGGGDKGLGDTACDRRQTGGFVRGDTFEGVQNADDRAEQSDERCGGTDGGKSGEAALHFGVNNGDGTLQAALGGFDDFRVRNLLRSGLEFREAGGDNLGDVALLVALGDGDCFIELAILESARNLLNEQARLLARIVVHEEAVNHDTERVHREDEENNDDDLGEESHGSPHVA